ncbi:LAGLIDADG family homing endonuclease [Clostridium sp. Cult2]|uniref:LAGLIDADG family homing endonuclease n=1 Tax=Clostridium sp. Cult2 TaxID=2079003 RepID=UPI001F249568|nr:hypothetical protein [Clostridium sp. Cult2]
MTETEKAYIAGIVDGEGSIMLTRFHKNEYPSPCVSISSTDMELLEWIKNTTKMGRIINKKNYNKEKHLNSYTYRVIYDDALKLLEEIETYLVIEKKKLRARHILDNYKKVTPRNGKYSEELEQKKEQFYADFMAL